MIRDTSIKKEKDFTLNEEDSYYKMKRYSKD
jgi:hypothetical protein